MLKCVLCMLQRTLAQRTVLRNLRTSHQINIKKEEISNGSSKDKRVPNIPDEYRTVFHFPYIRHFSVINRLKVYQTGITGLVTSGGVIANQLDYISTDLLQYVAVLGIASCFPLYALGFFTGKFIGYIYYNEKTNMARIAYTDYWGRRKDLNVNVDDIIPLDDLPVTRWSSLWFTFSRYSTKDTLRLNTKYGIFLDEEALRKII